MRKSRYINSQILAILKQAQAGPPKLNGTKALKTGPYESCICESLICENPINSIIQA